jgi:AbrB family looped-hinge helix DNA binding protein
MLFLTGGVMSKATAKITTKGQVTIPKKLRDDLGLREGDEIEFLQEGNTFRIRKLARGNPFEAWRGYAKHLSGMTVDELMDEMRGPVDLGD